MKIEVDSNAKAYASEAIEINAPVEKVYALMANFAGWPKWLKNVQSVTMNGAPQEGKDFTWKAKGLTIKSKLHTVQPNSAIGWTGKIAWIKAVHNWRFEAVPGGTNVLVEESLSGFAASLMKNSLRKDMQNDLLTLKQEAEK